MSDMPTTENWRDLDGAEAGQAAVAYLEDAAAALAAARLRSHECLGVATGSSVLDVGCGTGIALREIAEIVGPTGCVAGVDLSTAMLAEAQARLADVPARVELLEGTATNTGLDANRFDAVRTERVLMHVADQPQALRELARVTRPGGSIVLVEPDHRRLAIDTDHPEVWFSVLNAFSTMLPNISSGLRARSDAVQLGLPVRSVEPVTYQFTSLPSFSGVFQVEMAREAARAQGVTNERFDALLSELASRDAAGRFLAVGVMYVVVLEKP